MPRRLTSDESRDVFRALLDALANPGRPAALGVSIGGAHPVELAALALADLDVGVHVLGPDAMRVGAEFVRFTGTRSEVTAPNADMVVALDGVDPGELAAVVATMRRGDAFHPEAGARLFVGCRELAAADPHERGAVTAATRIWVSGPGATPGRTFDAFGVTSEVFEAIQAANRDFPAGIDTWLIADDAVVVGVPRSCQIEMIAKVAG